jgi:hypothetical protein
VPHRWATLKNAVTWIGDAGGIAIVAHPARYKFSPTEEYALFTEFKGHGGRGVEVVTGSHTAAEAERYAGTAKEFDLLASRGSDFHSPDESRIDLGGLPPLPATLTPVWDALAERIHQAGLGRARAPTIGAWRSTSRSTRSTRSRACSSRRRRSSRPAASPRSRPTRATRSPATSTTRRPPSSCAASAPSTSAIT